MCPDCGDLPLTTWGEIVTPDHYQPNDPDTIVITMGVCADDAGCAGQFQLLDDGSWHTAEESDA